MASSSIMSIGGITRRPCPSEAGVLLEGPPLGISLDIIDTPSIYLKGESRMPPRGAAPSASSTDSESLSPGDT